MRKCTIENETLQVILDNCKEHLEKRNTIYLTEVVSLLEKALEGLENKKDLCDSEIEDIKRIRKMIKGL